MRQSVLTVTLLVLVALAWALRDLLMLVAFAGLIAYTLDPVVSWVERRGLPGRREMPRGVAATIVMLLLVLVAGAALIASIPPLVRQITEFARAAPEALQQLEQQARAVIESRGWGRLLGDGNGDTSGTISSLLGAIEHGLMSQVGGLLGSLSGLSILALLPLVMILGYVIKQGFLSLNWAFSFSPPTTVAARKPVPRASSTKAF